MDRPAMVTSRKAATRKSLPTETVLTQWRPGSGDWDWPTEFADIVQEDDGATIAGLIGHIAKNGMLKPILLGDDGRVWDGHHRLLAARILGIADVPVEYGYGGNESFSGVTE